MLDKTKAGLTEQGNIVLMSLLVFFIVSILMMLILQLAVMEHHMSQYYFHSQQAQQLADAVLEQRCAEISRCLRSDYGDNAFLPALPLGWQENWSEIPTGISQGRCQTRFLANETGVDYCKYKLRCVGCFENAVKSVEADLTFHFTNTYDAEHNFLSREFIDGGEITSYQILNDL